MQTNEYKRLSEFYPTPPELAAKMVRKLEKIDFYRINSVKWENGSGLNVVYGVDEVEKV